MIKRGDVFWVKLDPVLGSEAKKTRPAVILSNDIGNEFSSRVVVVPITSQVEKVYPFESLIILNQQKAKIMADQIRSIDKTRLGNFIQSLTDQEIKELEKAVKIVLEI
jgi:mRNA interferase MazF